MNTYRHILIGLDLSEQEAKAVASKALALATSLGARVSFAHVIEPLTFAYAGDIPVDLSETQAAMEQHAEKSLNRLVSDLGATAETVRVVIGPTADELRHLAGEINADLIVVGSHARHGLALLLGSTASHVLRGAECDVLAVRI